MKRIPFELFGPGQYLYFDIGRLAQVESLTGKSIGDVIRNQDLNLGSLTVLLSVGLRHHGAKSTQWFEQNMQKLIDEGHEIDEFTMPVVRAIAGSGILGRAVYNAMFPEESTPEFEAEVAKEQKK